MNISLLGCKAVGGLVFRDISRIQLLSFSESSSCRVLYLDCLYCVTEDTVPAIL
jgi:hypothetical protein